MDFVGIFQVVAAPLIATCTTLTVHRLANRDRISAFVGWTYYYDHEDEYPHRPIEYAYVAIHNRSPQPVVITAVRYIRGSVTFRRQEGTALSHEDPTDLNFPYLVAVGDLKTLALDVDFARRLVNELSRPTRALNFVTRRKRLMIECIMSNGFRLRIDGEQLLPWQERRRYARG